METEKECITCFKKIDERATKCPYCGEKYGFVNNLDKFAHHSGELGKALFGLGAIAIGIYIVCIFVATH